MDDLISRQAAIDALMPIYKSASLRNRNVFSTARKCMAAIEDLPSAQPERKKGKWIEISSTSHTYKCSECGRLLVNITDGKNNVARNYPYCHCGADMRGEQE